MTNIVIKNLSENLELDNEAMRAVVGGGRTGAQKFNPQNVLRKRGSSILGNVIGGEKLRGMISPRLS